MTLHWVVQGADTCLHWKGFNFFVLPFYWFLFCDIFIIWGGLLWSFGGISFQTQIIIKVNKFMAGDVASQGGLGERTIFLFFCSFFFFNISLRPEKIFVFFQRKELFFSKIFKTKGGTLTTFYFFWNALGGRYRPVTRKKSWGGREKWEKISHFKNEKGPSFSFFGNRGFREGAWIQVCERNSALATSLFTAHPNFI